MGENLLPRTLLILRHAKSAWDTDAATDYDRPLNKRGKRDAPRMGDWLQSEGLIPDHIVSSPARRAEQTVLEAIGVMGLDEDAVRWDEDAYGAGPDTWLALLTEVPDDARIVLIVGHNPGLDLLVEHLAGDAPYGDDGKLMVTAAVARLNMPATWDRLERGCAELVCVQRPRELVDD
ncbi:MAG: SixA phosphatase family protein [Planctomycetota bacterium]|jgi:phosphohistidine phosphatase